MITRFKSALNQVKADDLLVGKTEAYLRDAIAKQRHNKSAHLNNWSPSSKRKIVVAAAAIVFCLVGTTGAYAYYQKPVSYLCMDINPSVEIGINPFDKVVCAEGYNADGKTVLKGIDVKGTDVKDAVNILMGSVIDNGFLAGDGSTVVSLTSVSDDAVIGAELAAEAEAGVEKAIGEEGKTALIYKDNVSLSVREEARAQGVSTGKLNLIYQIQSNDPNIVEKYKNKSENKIRQEIKKSNENGDKENNGQNTQNNGDDEDEPNGKDKDTQNDNNGANKDNRKITRMIMQAITAKMLKMIMT
jgi:hypothetical protein